MRRILGIMGVLAAIALLAACGERATEMPPDLTPPDINVDSTPSGHEGSEGLVLGSDSDKETVYAGALCDPSAPVRDYSLVAINVEISLNRYLDYDHLAGCMFLRNGWKKSARKKRRTQLPVWTKPSRRSPSVFKATPSNRLRCGPIKVIACV